MPHSSALGRAELTDLRSHRVQADSHGAEGQQPETDFAAFALLGTLGKAGLTCI